MWECANVAMKYISTLIFVYLDKIGGFALIRTSYV